MLLERLVNNISDKQYTKIYEYLLGILSGIMVFSMPGTIAILFFVFFNVIYYKRFKWHSSILQPVIIISIPFLLNILFIWNNDSFYEGMKHTEKYISMLIFPLLILGQYISISINKVLSVYTFVFTLILILALGFHVLLNLDIFETYLNGAMVWQMGYKFALSVNSHAPALNMHVAFLVVANYYLMLSSFFKTQKRLKILYRILFFVLALLVLFIINTRIAVVNAFIGIFIITVAKMIKGLSKKRILILSTSIFLFLSLFSYTFIRTFPYVIGKYNSVTFKHMDKIGKLDDFDNPEGEVFNALVTRLSIWKTAYEISLKHPYYGVGAADSKKALTQAYIDTNQFFLAKYKFPTHNQYLDFLLKFGFLGFLGVMFYMFYILRIAIKAKSELALFFFVLFLTSNITDDFLIRYDGITFSALWITLFASIYYNNVRRAHVTS